MNYCRACKLDFSETTQFCEECGARLFAKPQARAQSVAPPPEEGKPGVKIQDGFVTGGIHISNTDSRTIISQQDETREVLTCELCGAHTPKPSGFTCPKCNRFVCANDYQTREKLCADCLRFQETAAMNQYGALLDRVMQDGRIDAEERSHLDRARIALGLSEEVCARLERERRSAALKSAELSRRDQVLLEEARQFLFKSLKFEEAFKAIKPLFQRFADHPEIRRIYLLSLIEVQPDQAPEVIDSMRFDDLDKSLAHLELLSRRGDFDRAYDVLKDARRAFGDYHPDLTAAEADLALEESRATGTQSLIDVASECLSRVDPASSDFARFVHAYLIYRKGEAHALDLLAQAGNFYARRRQQRITRSAATEKNTAATQPPKTQTVREQDAVTFTPPVHPPPPPPEQVVMPSLIPGAWQLKLVTIWGQSYFGSCQVTIAGPNVMLVADVAGQIVLWDGLLHYFQERSIFRGTLAGTNLVATCGELVRMVDGMAVPVPGLPMRMNATIGNQGRSLAGSVINTLGESTQVFLSI
jgi:tetratricopeptide (TPR) repeat protein